MTKAELLTLLGWRMGDRSDLAPRAELELDFVQDMQLEGKSWCPWFLLQDMAATSTSAGVRQVPLPDDFLMELEESHLYAVNAEGVALELEKKDLDLLEKRVLGDGFPMYYAVVGENFYLYPKPDAVYSLQMKYYAKDARIKDEVASPKWLQYASDVVLAELGAIIAGKHLKDMAAAAGFSQDAQVAWKRLYDKHTAMGEINAPRSLGGNS